MYSSTGSGREGRESGNDEVGGRRAEDEAEGRGAEEERDERVAEDYAGWVQQPGADSVLYVWA